MKDTPVALTPISMSVPQILPECAKQLHVQRQRKHISP